MSDKERKIEQRFSSAGTTLVWFTSLLIAGMLTQVQFALGIDSNRPLTQALLRKWQVQQGLPRAALFSIRQSADGFIWLGTQSGLYRFDGVSFSSAKELKSVVGKDTSLLSEAWIQDLCEDNFGGLWVGTDEKGLIRLNEGRATLFDTSTGMPSDQIRCLFRDQAGNIWIGTSKGPVKWDGKRLQFKPFQSSAGDFDCLAIGQTTDGQLWFAAPEMQIQVWNERKLERRFIRAFPAENSINALLGSRDGKLWVGTTAGIVCISGQQEETFTQEQGLANDWVNCLRESRDASIWVGTKDGLSRFRSVTSNESIPAHAIFESFRSRDGLSQSTVFTICEDHEGSMWVGTKNGLNQMLDRRTIPFTTSEGLPSNDMGPILQDRSGKIWVGTLDAGLTLFDEERFLGSFSEESGLPSDQIISLAEGHSGDLWVGTERGLCRMNSGQVVDHFTALRGLPSDVVNCICQSPSGVLWAGTKAGLVQLEGDRFVLPENGTRPEFRQSITALYQFGEKSLIVATRDGHVYRYDGKSVVQLPTGEIPPCIVDAIYEDQDGLLWIGTRGFGAIMIDKDRHVRFTTKQGLYDDDIFGIVADNEGRLWMACSRGLFFVDKNELRTYSAGRQLKIKSTQFSPTDAQRTIECQSGVQPTLCKTQSGRIWFATTHGVIVIDPVRMQRSLPLPSVVVESVRVNGQTIRPTAIGRLPPGQTNLDFRYAALSFASPTRINFRYKLEGFDENWIDAGSRREAFYTNLPPGVYRFRVSAANPESPWSESRSLVEFELTPYFYQTQWFIPLLLSLIAVTGWISFRFRVRQIKLQLRAVLAERVRIARELHDTLLQGFSGVTMQLQALASRLRHSPERLVLEDIIHDAGNCLREARRSVAGLRNSPETGSTSGFVDAIRQSAVQLTEAHDIRLVLHLKNCPHQFTPDVEYHLLKIMQEAVTNSVKHAHARRIDITLSPGEYFLDLQVTDDGQGFHEQLGIPDLPGHYGLIGMHERAKQIRGELTINSKPAAGTTVTIRVPFAQPASSDHESKLHPHESDAINARSETVS